VDGELGLDEGAVLVRERLSAAVSAVTAAGGVVSSDLSGGYDSTSISYLAAAGPVRVELVTAESRDPTSEGACWARLAAGGLPHCSHHWLPADDLPLIYAGVGDDPLWLDEPSAVAAARDRVVAVLKLASEAGSRLHLTGHGGDHLFTSMPTHFHDMMRSNTRIAMRQLRGFAHLYGWSTSALLRALADRRDYWSWWTAHTEPGSGPLDIRTPPLGWATPPTLPSWVTAQAATTITLLVALLERIPTLRGVLVDLPRNEDDASALFRQAGVEDRCEFVAGDFFRRLPPADGYLLCDVLHNWDDDDVDRIIDNCVTAGPAASLVVVEPVASSHTGAGAAHDLLLLAVCGGRRRTVADFVNLMAKHNRVLVSQHTVAGERAVLQFERLGDGVYK
jgi:O-methyltransferase domain/Asparagine synthase